MESFQEGTFGPLVPSSTPESQEAVLDGEFQGLRGLLETLRPRGGRPC